MEMISWTDRVNGEKILNEVKKERNILLTGQRRKVKWICYITLRHCSVEQVIEGKIEETRWQGRSLTFMNPCIVIQL
jgi:hypothetical protein